MLGQALRQALGDKRGIRRYGHALLPMDEALAEAAVDISGRPFLAWSVPFGPAKVGEMDTELFEEFFRAFAFNAGITLHVDLEGRHQRAPCRRGLLQGGGAGAAHGRRTGPARTRRGALDQGDAGGLMRVWTVHVPPIPATGTAGRPPRRAPVLVREGSPGGRSCSGRSGCCCAGCGWRRCCGWWSRWRRCCWRRLGGLAVLLALQFLLGCHARDLQRRALERRGYDQAHVVAERDEDRALARLLAARPELAVAWGRAALA